jgi:hypothetical protein
MLLYQHKLEVCLSLLQARTLLCLLRVAIPILDHVVRFSLEKRASS